MDIETADVLVVSATCDADELQAKRLKRPPTFVLGIAGLELLEGFITLEEERVLLQHIDDAPWNTSLARRTQHYGYLYNYTSKVAAQKAPQIPKWCEYVVDRLLEQGVVAERPDQLIVNEYTPGQGIYPHIDHTGSFADGIVSISLGAPIVMDFIKGDDASLKKELSLAPKSALVLHGEARYEWRHGITARKKDHGAARERRVSLTFRKMKL